MLQRGYSKIRFMQRVVSIEIKGAVLVFRF